MTLLKLTDLKVDGSHYLISLVKLSGQPIADVRGYLSIELGEVAFKLCEIVLEDGTTILVEGEHDFPYLSTFRGDAANLNENTLIELYEQGK